MKSEEDYFINLIRQEGYKQGILKSKERIKELEADIQMLKAENKELKEKLNACEKEVYLKS